MTAWEDWRGEATIRKFQRKHPGKLGILVYSNSPNWQRYIEERWLPVYQHHFVVLNWSDRSNWDVRSRFEAKVFRRYTGPVEYNPVVILLGHAEPFATFRAWVAAIRAGEPFGMLAPSAPRARVIRFWKAFRDYKHGKPRALEKAEAELATAVSKRRTV